MPDRRSVRKFPRRTAQASPIILNQDPLNRCDHEVSRPRCERAVGNRRIKRAEVLADQGLWNQTVAKPGKEPVDRSLRLRMRPVVADAITEAEVTL